MIYNDRNIERTCLLTTKKQHLFSNKEVLRNIQEVEKSPEKQAILRSVKEEMSLNRSKNQTQLLLLVFVVFILMAFFKILGFVLGMVLLIFSGNWYQKRNKKNHISYVDYFLLPVLREILPNIKIDYEGGIEEAIFDLVTPNADTYQPNCHILFKDEYNTEFCNLYSYHTNQDSEGNTTVIEDFKGQVLMAKYATGLVGHVRIVPTSRGFFGREFQVGYKKAENGEKKIETEDIHFNETFNVYGTDEVSSRILLNPYLLTVLSEYREKYPVTIWMDENKVSVSFYTGYQILQAPSCRKDIENLSLSTEYEKVQDSLSDFYDLLDTINTQL